MTASPERSRTYTVAFFVVLLVAVLALSVVVLIPFLSAIAWAAVLAVAVRPVWVRIERLASHRRSLAAAATALLVTVVVLLPAGVLGAALASQAAGVASRLVASLKAQDVSSVDDLLALPVVGQAFEWVRQATGITPQTLKEHAADLVARLSTFLAATGGGVVVGLFGALGTFLLSMFLLFFFLRDGEEMVEALAGLLPVSVEERKKTMRRFGSMLKSIFKGSLLTALVQGALGGIGWALAGLPSSFLAGTAMAVLSLLPIGGTMFVWLPGAAALALQGRHGAAIFLFLWGAAIVASVDNFLKPLLIKGGGEMNTLVVFLGVFGGLAAFGLLGVFIGPIVLATAQTLLDTLRSLARGETEEPGIPAPAGPPAA